MNFLLLALLLGAQADALEARRFPPELTAGVELDFFREFARIAGLTAEPKIVEGSERLPGTPLLLHRAEVTGRGSFDAVGFFLESIGRRDWRASDLESFRVGPDGAFSARFVLPTIDLDSEHRFTAAMAERFKSSNLQTLATLLSTIPDNRAIHLTEVRSGHDISMRGVVVGAAARAQVPAWLEEKGFGGSTLTMPEEGACRPFAVTIARGRPGERVTHVTQRVKLDRADTALCATKASKHRGAVTARGNGSIYLRLRKADVSTLAYVLHDLTGENFLLDSDVDGTVDVDAAGATAETLIAAMTTAGLHVSGPPVRRISRTDTTRAPTPPREYGGEPVSLSLQRAAPADVFCLFTTLTGLDLTIPRKIDGAIAVYVRDQPWDLVLNEIIHSAGLTFAMEGNRVFLGGAGKDGGKPCDLSAAESSPSLTNLHLAVDKLSAADLELIGRARLGEPYRAYAYAPWRSVVKLEGGEKLFEERVRAIGAEAVTFEWEGKPFEISYDEVSVPALVGAWECVSGPCLDPQVSFGLEEKVRVFRSWLHNRPAMIGTWSVRGSTVTVDCCSGMTLSLEIVRVNRKELVLREEGDDEAARYRRIEED
jgi:hypothetical protein